MNSVLYITLLIALIALVKGDDFYCYSGSSIYELQVQNCKNENTSYTGTWYCGSMKICESYMDSGRECVTTRYVISNDIFIIQFVAYICKLTQT